MVKGFFVNGSKEFMKLYNSLDSKSPLKRDVDNAIDTLKRNPLSGEKIQKQLWPEKYVKRHQVNNLFRYRLAGGYRLIYTIVAKSNNTTSVILDALDHGEYDNVFGYDTS